MIKEAEDAINKLMEIAEVIHPYTSSDFDKIIETPINIMKNMRKILINIQTLCKEEDGWKSGEEGYEWIDGVREGRYNLAQEILELIKENEVFTLDK